MELVNDGTGLGFGIVGGKTTGVIVKTILPGGIADQVTSMSWMHHTLVFRGFASRNQLGKNGLNQCFFYTLFQQQQQQIHVMMLN